MPTEKQREIKPWGWQDNVHAAFVGVAAVGWVLLVVGFAKGMFH